MGNDVKLGITAEDTGLQAALTAATASVKTAAEQMSGAFGSVTEAFGKLNVAFAAIGAVLAGGAAFKEAINTTVNLNKESVALGRQFGITATEASQLKVAMASVNVSQDTVTAAGARITQALKKNEQAFTDLGVATRDSNGDFRNQLEIMQDVSGKLLTFREGTDRNVEGAKIFGRSWTEVSDVLKLTPAIIEEAKVKSDSLNLTVGQESVAATQRYRSAMNSVHEVFEGVAASIGNALMPVLSQLGEWFASIGPQAVQVIRGAMLGLVTVFEALKTVVVVDFDVVKGTVGVVGEYFVALGKVVWRTLTGDFSGALDAFNEGLSSIKSTVKKTWDEMKSDAAAGVAAVSAQMDIAFNKQTATKSKEGGATSEGGDDKEKSRMKELENTLAQKKVAYEQDADAHGQTLQYSKQQELDYWNDVLATVRLNTADRLAIETKVAAEQLKINQDARATELAQLKTKEAAYKNDLDAKLAIERQYLTQVGAIYGAESKEYEAARKTVVDTERQIQAQLVQLQSISTKAAEARALAEINADQTAAQHSVAMGKETSEELLQQEQEFENRRYAIRKAALEADKALQATGDTSKVKVAELNAQLEQLETTHQASITKIKNQAALEQNKIFDNAAKAMQASFQSGLAGILQGTTSISGGLRNIWTGTTKAITNAFAQMVTQNIAHMFMQHAVGKEISLKEITANAAKAASSAFSAVAGIPYIGPFLAPAAAAAAFAGALAFGAEVSAAGGADIGNVAPIAQLHPKEMVLPEGLADRVRKITEPGQPGGPSADGRPVTVQMHAKDYGGGFFMTHADDIEATVKQLARNGKLVLPR